MHPSTRPIQWARGDLPEVLTAHPNVGEEFVVMWGTINHIYVTESARSALDRATLGQRGLIEWIVRGIRTSFPECLGTLDKNGSKSQDDMEKDTKFVIYGLDSRTPASSDTNRNEEELEWQRGIVAEFCKETRRPKLFWDSKIDIRSSGEAGYCYGCKTRCD
jgi:hypothetical protein